MWVMWITMSVIIATFGYALWKPTIPKAQRVKKIQRCKEFQKR